MDSETDGIATGLSTCLLKDGTQTVTANIPMSTFKFTGLGAGTANTDSATVGQLQNQTINWIAGGGSADAITATYSPAVTTLTDGMLLSFRATAANATTTPTLSPSGLTARTIVRSGGTALAAGDIAASLAEYFVRYNLANTRWELLNPACLTPAATQTITNKTLDLTNIDSGFVVTTAQVDVTSSTSIVLVTGCVLPLAASHNYLFEIHVTCTSGASGGIKFALDTPASPTSISYTGYTYNGATLAAVSTSVVGAGEVGNFTGITTNAIIKGAIQNGSNAGNLRLFFAQNASNGTPSSVKINSFMWAKKVS